MILIWVEEKSIISGVDVAAKPCLLPQYQKSNFILISKQWTMPFRELPAIRSDVKVNLQFIATSSQTDSIF